MSFAMWVMVLGVVTAVCCALPGIWLVLRRQSMLTDAISHSVLPGVVVASMIVGTLNSPWAILGAAIMGMLVVMGADYLESTGLISGDGPQGLIFPALFSVGVILVSTRFNQVSVSESAILVGDLNLAAFLQWNVGGVSLGPQYLWVMLVVLALITAFLVIFRKELALFTFDSELAQTMGFRVRLFHQAMMLLVSITITASFHAAGAVLVVALMIVPAAVAQRVTHSLAGMYAVTLAVTVVCSIVGFWLAYALDAATSSGLALFYGLVFVTVHVITSVLQRRSR